MKRMERCLKALIIAALLLVSGCAQIPAVFDYRPYEDLKQSPVWPAAPELARYGFVGQLTGEENFPRPGEKTLNAGVKFLRWLVGLVGHGEAPVVLQRPQAVISDGLGRVFVSDVSRQAVYLFDTQKAELNVWQYAAKDIRFELPIGLALAEDGGLLVADASLRLISHLASNGEPLAQIGYGELEHPTGLARDPVSGQIFVADRGSNSIKVFSAAGELLTEFSGFGEAKGELNGPTYLFWHDEKLYVTDTLNSRIQVFSAQGEYISGFGQRGMFLGDLPRPKGVAVDKAGKVYVVESFYDYLLIFNQDGELLLPIGGSGHEVGQFYLPAGVWVDDDYVYVADTFNGRVMVFEYLGDGNASDVAGDGSSGIVDAARD